MRVALPRPAPSWWRAAFVAASIAWAVLLAAVPFLASRAHASTLGSALIVGVYALGSLICHQLPGRSYHPWGAQMPVCARCAGIYCGGVIGAVASSIRLAVGDRSRRAPARHRFLVSTPARVSLALAVLPTLVTLAYEWTMGQMPAHGIRFAAGVPIGVVAAWLVVAASDNQVN